MAPDGSNRKKLPVSAMNNAKPRPILVEDESPQEFYASLIGNKPRAVNTSKTAPSSKNQSQYSSTLPVVASEEASVSVADAEFNIIYKRAISDPPQLSSLSLGPSNKGFKLLTSMGWKEHEGGLGKRRQGNLTPVKTQIENDKRGLGRGRKMEERVTHHPHEKASVRVRETKTQRKRRRKAETEKEQRSEKRVRMLLRTDVSDEYEQLYMGLHGG
jgi:hypothetical protein